MDKQYTLNANQADVDLCIKSTSPVEFFEAVIPNSDKKLRKVKFNAYNGGAVSLSNLFFPVVFELSTLKKSGSIPLLYVHNLEEPVGHATDIKVSKASIDGEGVISGSGKRAKEVLEASDNQFPWQLSVGIRGDKLIFYASDETFEANGQTFSGPKYLARDGLLREISFTPAGADDKTSAKFAASFYNGGYTMRFEEWLASLGYDPATMDANLKASLKKQFDEKAELQAKLDAALKNPVNDDETKKKEDEEKKKKELPSNSDMLASLRSDYTKEVERINSIKELDAQYNSPKDDKGGLILTAAINGNWTVEKAHLEMLKAARPANIGFGGSGGDSGHGETQPQVLEAALAQAGKLPDVDKMFPEKILEAAHKRYRSRIGLQEFLLEAAYMGGYRERSHRIHDGNLRDILKAAFSTHAIPGILANNGNKYLVAGFNTVDNSWRALATITSLPDFKETTGYRGVGSFTMEDIGPAGQIPHASMTEAEYGNRVKTVAKMFVTTREDIKNDDLGALTSVPRGLGRGGALKLVKTFWIEFLNNSGNFWHANNDNVSTGALSIAGLNALESVLMKQTDENSDYIMSELKVLAVPTELYATASDILTAQGLVGGTTTAPNRNRWQGRVSLVTSPYMSDPTISGNSASAYYGLVDPQDIPTIEVAFLDGVERPTIESTEADFNVLGFQWRGYFDFGIRKQEPRGSVRSTGV